MNQDGTRDLQWWHIPQWVPPAPRTIVAGLVAGPVLGLAAGIAGVLIYGLAFGLVLGLSAGLVVGLGISRAWPAALAAAQLARRWHTPLRLMNFLDDARERNILRTMGPVYQFRHARLQDRLAANDRHDGLAKPALMPTVKVAQ